MRAIIVDDEPIMLNVFLRLSSGIKDLQIVGRFQKPEDALSFAGENSVDVAFLDVIMPFMSGIELAGKLREIRPDILIVFISAYDEYIRESNRIGGDYYIVKPYKTETLEIAMERIRLLARRQRKDIYIRTFGIFSVLVKGKPIPLRGKAKEILAMIVVSRGKEISNEEIFRTIWENRPYSNDNMTVYYNAVHRLKQTLKREDIEDLLISTPRGQMADISKFDCDYYDWLDGKSESSEAFRGEFLPEYSWSEYLIGSLSRNPFYEE